MNIYQLTALFIFLSAIVIFAGSKLTYYAEVIEQKTGIGRIWIGIILIATITSLPELTNSLSSVIFFNTPDIAVGNIFGSCIFNLSLIAVLDLYFRPKAFLSRVDRGHVLSASFSIFLYLLVIYAFLSERLFNLKTYYIGFYSPIIIISYFFIIRSILRYEYKKGEAAPIVKTPISLKTIYIKFTAMALTVIVAALFLPGIGEQIANMLQISQTFIGTLFIAITTSLPEATIAFYAFKIGSYDLAIANILGSNLFNILILAFTDLFFLGGSLFKASSFTNLLTVTSAGMMTALIILSITSGDKLKKRAIDWTTPLIFLLFFLNTYLVFVLH